MRPQTDRIKSRTRSVTAKVTPTEELLLKAEADRAGLTLSEWSREALLSFTKVSPDTRLLLAETMALRMVVVRLLADSIQGIKPSEERLKILLQQADQAKFQHADTRAIAGIHKDTLPSSEEAN